MQDAEANFPTQGTIARWLKRPNLKGIAFELKQLLPNVGSAKMLDSAAVERLLLKCGISDVDDRTSSAAATVLASIASRASLDDFRDRAPFVDVASRFGCKQAVTGAFGEAATRHFRAYYERLIDAGEIDEQRRAAAIEFGASLGMTFDQTQAAVNGIVGPMVQQRVSQILEDTMMSPDEEASLEALATRLGVKLQTSDNETQRVFALARTRWQIAQGTLPLVDCPLMLKRGEVCHGVVTAMAYEERQRSVRTSYHGVSTRVKIVRGVYYNAGSYRTMRTTEAYSFPLGSGHLVVTNKRVLFSSDKKSMSAALDSIIDWTLYSDGIELKRATGKPVTYVFGSGNGLFLEVLVAARKKFIG